MLTDDPQPFLASRAFVKDTSSYVTFPTQSDAMLASLQLFHDVPCRIMDLIFTVVTHPNFDSKQISLASSVDIIRTVEDARLKDRMSIKQERSRNNEQVGLPHFVLEEVLDILAADRAASIKARFEKELSDIEMYTGTRSFRPEEDVMLANLSLVHRSWTFPAQKALGQSLYIGRALENMDCLLQPSLDMSVLGPWTSLVAIDLYRPVETFGASGHVAHVLDAPSQEGYLRWLEVLHRVLLRFANIKCIYVRSHFSRFTEWFNATIWDMIRQSTSLEELTLEAVPPFDANHCFNLQPLVRSKSAFNSLRSLSVRGTSLPNVESLPQEISFTNLRDLTFDVLSDSLKEDLKFLIILARQPYIHLESIKIYTLHETREEYVFCLANYLTHAQCISLFAHCTLFVETTKDNSNGRNGSAHSVLTSSTGVSQQNCGLKHGLVF